MAFFCVYFKELNCYHASDLRDDLGSAFPVDTGQDQKRKSRESLAVVSPILWGSYKGAQT